VLQLRTSDSMPSASRAETATLAAVWFAYTPDRKGEHPRAHLSKFTGTLQADGYAGFEQIYEAGRIREAACWAHVRRKFYDLVAAHKSPVATEALERIGALYAIEKEIRGRSPEERREVRNQQTRPLLESFKQWLEATLGKLSRKSDRAGGSLRAGPVGSAAALGRRWRHRDHGWDATQQPVLADIKWHGETTPALFLANRNAFFYGLDRRNGKYLFATPYARQSWASGFTPDGDPIVLSTSHPTRGGSVVSPASNGATNWWAPSFDPTRNLMFIPCADTTDTYFKTDETEYHEWRTFLGSGYQRAHTQPTTLALRAIDVTTGQMRWDSTLETGGAKVPGEMGGVLSTEGDLVFAGFDNEFHAFDADTGASLWKMPLGGIVHAAPISYMIAGHQYIAVFAGRTLFVCALPTDNPGGATHLPQIGSRASQSACPLVANQ
jgi:outer membrane protein assembly factor BamB